MKILIFSLLVLISNLYLSHCQQYNGRVLVLKGRVFVDSNKDTKYQTNEPGFGGVLVTPLDNAVDYQGQRLQPFYTNANGEFIIDGLKESTLYRFNYSNPNGYYFENYDIGLNCPSGKTCVRNALPSEGYKGTIVVENVSGYEIPIIPNGNALGGTSILCLRIQFDLPPETPKPSLSGIAVVGNIFIDGNANGLKDMNETWYSGLQLILVDSNGNVIKDSNGNLLQSVTTDSNGRYVFENIPEGQYFLKIVGGLNGAFNPGLIGKFNVTRTVISTTGDGVKSSYITNLGNYGLIPSGFASCSGYAYWDLNFNLQFDGNENGIAGILVKIYAPVYNFLLFQVYTGADGKWFVNGLYPGMNYTCIFIYNVNNYTSTGQPPARCITGGQTDINCGLSGLESNTNTGNGTNDYPYGFATTCFVKGDFNGTNKNEGTVVTFPANASGNTYFPDIKKKFLTMIAAHKDTGSVFGITQRPESGDIYVSSYYKDNTGFGPSGPGAIYRIDKSGNVSTYVDLNKIFGDGFTGPAIHNFTYLPTEYKYGGLYTSKVSLGDLQSTSRYLFVSNLFTNEIVQIPLLEKPISSNVFKMEVNNPCIFKDWRIFAVQVYKGQLYSGGVCTGESGSPLQGFIHRYNGTSRKWDYFLDFPLNYTRGGALWSQWDTGAANKPEPVFVSIVFDGSGDIAIALRDRYSDQRDDITPTPDLLYACINKYGDYQMESGGKCNGKNGWKQNMGWGIDGGQYLSPSATRSYNGATSAAYAGPNTVIVTASDPQGGYNSGVMWVDTNNGSVIQSFVVSPNTQPGSFVKASGLGGVTPLFNRTTQTVECGRIWFDCDGNGIQDCDEVGLSGINVYLYDNSNTAAPVSQTTSDSKGNFKFTVSPGKSYSCVIPVSEVNSKFGPFALSPVLTDPNLEYIDSDAQYSNGNLYAGYNSPNSSGHIFTDCHFGIVNPNTTTTNGYGYKMSNGSCVPNNNNPPATECPKETKQFQQNNGNFN